LFICDLPRLVTQFDGSLSVKSESVEVKTIDAAGVAAGPIVRVGFGVIDGRSGEGGTVSVGNRVGSGFSVGLDVAVGCGVDLDWLHAVRITPINSRRFSRRILI